MTRRHFNRVRTMGLVTTVLTLSVPVITAGLQWMSVPAMQLTVERIEGTRGIRARRAARKPGNRKKSARKGTKESCGMSARKTRHQGRRARRRQGHQAKLIADLDGLLSSSF